MSTGATTTTTAPNPAATLIDEARSAGQGCQPDSSWLCEWLFEVTGRSWLAGLGEWFVSNLTVVAVVLAVAFVAVRLAHRAIGRAFARVEARSRPGPRTEARTATLAAIARSAASIAIWVVAGLVVLDVIGISIGPLLAGAGIAGVALGFGAQYVVRDFLAGFFIVAEDQFGVGDIVDLGEASGTVEKVSFRTTRLRDVDGVVWHVPNGEIQRVANHSQEWARARLDVAVSYDEDLDTAIEAVSEIAAALGSDPNWSAQLLEAPEVWGVEGLDADGVRVRIVIKTQPAAQFAVLRELRRRLKNGFDERGLSMPGGFSIVHVEHTRREGRDHEPGPEGDRAE